MKKKLLLLLILVLVFNSCKKDLLQPNSDSLKNALSFTEAKQYFDANLKQLKLSNKLMSADGAGNASQKTTIEDILYNKQPIWDKAYQKLISSGTSVKIPIDFGKARKIVDERTGSYVPYSSLNYLLMYKDSLQRIHAEWVTLKPSMNWLKGNRSNFVGSIVIKDWNGAVLKKYNYGIANTVKVSKLSAIGGAIMGGGDETMWDDGCLIWASRDKCSCPWAWSSGVAHQGSWNPDKCDYCVGCVDRWCNPEPECTTCEPPPPPPTGGNPGNHTGGGSGYNPGGNEGGGGTGPGDYEPEDCTDGPQFVNPDGSMSPPPCIPEPTCDTCLPPLADVDDLPIDPATQVFSIELNRFITYGEIEDFYNSNPDVVQAIIDNEDSQFPWPKDWLATFNDAVNLEYSYLNRMHPDWDGLKVVRIATWNVIKGSLHFALDIAGMAPVVGEAADIVNGAIYFFEDDYLNAAISGSAAIPFYGWFSTGGKWVKKVITTSPLSRAVGKAAYRASKSSNGAVRFIKIAVGDFTHAMLNSLRAVKPADNTLTNLGKTLIDQSAQRISPIAQSLRNKVDDIVINGDNLGTKIESLCDDVFETNGFIKHDAKIGSNNGFDGVYIKKDASGNVQEIIINESKPVGSYGNIKLNAANPATQLPAQMSNTWIDNVIGRLSSQGGNLATLASVLNANKTKITKTVTGVDKATSEIVVLKLANY